MAEGIESEEQAALLADLGVDLAQGFLYGRPETAAQIDARLDPPDPEAPFAGPADDTSVFPPPVFPREAPPTAPPAATWPPADWAPSREAPVAEPAVAGARPGQWPDTGGSPAGPAVDLPPPED